MGEKIILGIDPGYAITGYGLIVKESKNKLNLLDYGCILTKSDLELPERLGIIHKELKEIISKFRPGIIAIEELFFCKNVKTALMVGQARGVVLLTAMEEKIMLKEFTPLEVKQGVTGYGKAEKKQIQKMVQIILKIKELPKPDDAADALAIAITAANSIV